MEHAAVLRRGGFDAFVYDEKRSFDTAYGVDIPVVRGSFKPGRGDIVVRGETFFPEVYRKTAATGAKQVVFVQNHYYVDSCLKSVRNFHELGVHAVAASSRPIVDFLLRHKFADDVTYLPYAVEPPAASWEPRGFSIAYMPRKLRGLATIIRGLFPILNPDLVDVNWSELDGLPHREVTRELEASAVFLSLQNLEGFGMPALEAMAAGCLVVGFTGGRGCEYAEDSNALWVGENDAEVAVLALGKALRWIRSGAPEAAAIVAAGQSTARRYSIEARDRAVMDFYDEIAKA